MNQTQSRTFKIAPLLTVRVPELIGSAYRKHLNKARRTVDALQSRDSTIDTQLLHIAGQGGIGKTFMLHQVRDELRKRPKLIVTDIIDFYDITLHSNLDLLEQVARNIIGQCPAEQRRHFEEYERLIAAFRAYQSGRPSPDDRAKIRSAFDDACKQLTEGDGYRVVVLLDTGELLEYHTDAVQRQMREAGLVLAASSRQWLRQAIADDRLLPYTLVIAASRKEPVEIYDEFRKLAGSPDRCIELDGMDDDDVLSYFKSLEQQVARKVAQLNGEQPNGNRTQQDIANDIATYEDIAERLPGLDDETKKAIGRVTDGLPVALALTAQLYLDGSLKSLDALIQMNATDPRKAKAQLKQAMVESLALYLFGDASQPLQYLSLMRKGMTAERLHDVWNPPGVELYDLTFCERVIEYLKQQTFIKTVTDYSVLDKPTEALVLHDEIADWCEDGFFMPNPERRKKTYERILERYQHEIADCYAQIRNEQDDERYDAKLRLPKLKIEQMFYGLRADPIRGFQAYYELAEDAFTALQPEFDAKVHAELVMWWDKTYVGEADRFKYRTEAIAAGITEQTVHADLAVRWIQRYYNDFRPDGKARTANLAQALQNGLQPQPNRLTQRTLELYELVAHTFSPLAHEDQQKIGKRIQQIVEDLSADLQATREAERTASPANAKPLSRLQLFLAQAALAFAYYQQGYFAVRLLADYDEAIRSYTMSNGLYRDINLENNIARSLNDRAYAQAQVGDLGDAEFSVRDALALREVLGYPRPVGLSLNTLGIVLTLSQRSNLALRYCQQALEIFSQIEDKRSQILALRALAEAHRREAETHASNPVQCEASLRQAIQCGKDALESSKSYSMSPLTQSDLLDEYGCAYRDLALFLKGQGKSAEAQQAYDGARQLLKQSAEVARTEAHLAYRLVDSLVNFAYLDFYFDHTAEANGILDEALNYCPDELRKPGRASFELDRSAFWGLLSKIFALKTRMAGAELNALDDRTQADQAEANAAHRRKVRADFVDAAILALYFASRLQDVRVAYRSKDSVYQQLKKLSNPELTALYRRAVLANRRLDIPDSMPRELRLNRFIEDKFGVRPSEDEED